MKYRTLKLGEVIMKGDEYRNKSSSCWIPSLAWGSRVGWLNNKGYANEYRRPIVEAQKTPRQAKKKVSVARSHNTGMDKIADDIECARDWLRTGKRKVKQIEINNCIAELNDIIQQLRHA